MGVLTQSRVGLFTLIALCWSCSRPARELHISRLNSPLPIGSVVPQLSSRTDGRVVLSWLEPRPDKGYRFRAAIGRDLQSEPPVTIDDSPDITMFSANLPGVAELPGGAMMAYWERADPKANDDPYATSIHLARSEDNGKSWAPIPSPHAGGRPGMHSFLSAFTGGSEFGLVWLDAQNQRHIHKAGANGSASGDEYLGAVGLRYASFLSDGRQVADSFIDPITCECCPTSAAVTSRGPIVVYRNRVAPPGARPEDIRYETATVRDIYLTRLENSHWSEPNRVYADNWVINGCPDNGPAVDASGNDVVVAWWTGGGDQPHVSVAFSKDSGTTFGRPMRISTKRAEGQVTVALVDHGAAIVGWLEEHQTLARWVDSGGAVGLATSLGPAPNHTRIPKWIGQDGRVLAVWNESADGQRTVRIGRLTP